MVDVAVLYFNKQHRQYTYNVRTGRCVRTFASWTLLKWLHVQLTEVTLVHNCRHVIYRMSLLLLRFVVMLSGLGWRSG